MNLGTIIILVALLGFSMLFVHLLTRRRSPRVTTITQRSEPGPRVRPHILSNPDAE